MARKAIYIHIILDKLGHKQPRTPIQTDNSTAEGIINNTVQPKQTKAMDMRFHTWLRDRELQKQLCFYWRSGKLNSVDYYTKHHSPAHHRNKRKETLTPQRVLENLAREKSKAAGNDIGPKHTAQFAMSVIHIQNKLLKATKEAQTIGKTVNCHCAFTGNTLCVFTRMC